MIVTILVVMGLSMGSFVNALVWRLYKQEHGSTQSTKIKGKKVDLSITTGRSVCVHCGHELGPKDLVPLLSWLTLRGKCRYCHKPIEDTPLAEIATPILFVLSYAYWPYELASGASWAAFVAWLMIVVGLVALAVYDVRHMILPNRIIFPLMGVSGAMRVFLFIADGDADLVDTLFDVVLGVIVGGGFFYALFQISGGRWIGGGDVKLGFLIGIVLGPLNAFIADLAAFYIAAFFILPLMLVGKVSRKSKIPFGPFLIAGFILVVIAGEWIRETYESLMGV